MATTQDLDDGAWAAGLVRRVRRAADLSQRDLAQVLGVSQSTVARWETGHVSPTLAITQALTAVAGLRLVLVDVDGHPVSPMRDDAARDRAARRYPAHVDPAGVGWWAPRDASTTAEWPDIVRRSRELGRPQVRFVRTRFWRSLLREYGGLPPDHPTRWQLLADIEARETAQKRRTHPD